jgi:hypothetical protein
MLMQAMVTLFTFALSVPVPLVTTHFSQDSPAA